MTVPKIKSKLLKASMFYRILNDFR